MKTLQVVVLGTVAYDAAFSLQNRLQEMRIAGDLPDTLILLEHPPTLTLARGDNERNILVPEDVLAEKRISVHPTDRGGDITLHGPGQVVGYPIMHLDGWGNDIHQYIRNLEQCLIRTLASYGVKGRRDAAHIGVWVGEEKIAAIGVKVKKWVTKHGFALNVNTDLSHFDLINPCGIRDKGVTSLKQLLGRDVDVGGAIERTIREFAAVFHVHPKEVGDAGKRRLLAGDIPF